MATTKPINMEQEDDGYFSPEVVQRFRERFQAANGSSADQYSREALDWFRREVTKNLNPKARQILESRKYKKKQGTTGIIGRLYLFEYEAKEAGDAETGVYDRFPLVFFFNVVKSADGNTVLYGLNMHYLAPAIRARVYWSLLQLKTQKNMNVKQRLKMEWSVIKAVANHQAVGKAVHAYRADRFVKPMSEIRPADWQIALFLQVQKWTQIQGKNKAPIVPHTPSELRKTQIRRGTIKTRRSQK